MGTGTGCLHGGERPGPPQGRAAPPSASVVSSAGIHAPLVEHSSHGGAVRSDRLGQGPQVWAPQGSPPLGQILADADIGPEPSRVV